jgi:hypothetical protein
MVEEVEKGKMVEKFGENSLKSFYQILDEMKKRGEVLEPEKGYLLKQSGVRIGLEKFI